MENQQDNRIELIMNFLGETAPTFAKKLQITPELVYMIQKGNRNISKQLANKIQDIFGIPREFSLNGEGELDIIDQLIKKDPPWYTVKDPEPMTAEEYTAPYLKNVNASAGLSFLTDNSSSNPESYIKIPGLRVDAYINVFGDSMYPKYKSGQVIGIKQIEKDMVYFGYAYVIEMSDGEAYIKYIQPGKETDCWSLESENKHYGAQEFHLDKIRRVFKVKSVLTRESM